MTALPVSIVIASRGRPGELRRCLIAVSQLAYPNFEVIVVADPAGLAVAQAFPVRAVACDRPNISVARNLGIAAAAGAVVAFIDDDAVPEPLWLRHIAEPFDCPEVAAAGGVVLGRNGISLQWQSGTVDRLLRVGPLPVPSDQPSRHRAQPGCAVEIKGVNCAYRRSVLAALGGFDPELRYYLDETELNLRLAALNKVTVIVPRARVHHGKAASEVRRADRAPLSLWDVGASSAVTLRRHGATAAEVAAAQGALQAAERGKLNALMTDGKIGPPDVDRLMRSLAEGFADGMARNLGPLAPLPEAEPRLFQLFQQVTRHQVILSGRAWSSRRLHSAARELAGEGAIVRLFLFSPTAHYHRVGFCDDGYWVQTGGLFGKSLRTDKLFHMWRFRSRLGREIALWGDNFR